VHSRYGTLLRRRSAITVNFETRIEFPHTICDDNVRVTTAAAGSSATSSTPYSEDMSYAFGAPITDGLDPFSATSYSRGDKLFSETVLKYWTNFIKTG